MDWGFWLAALIGLGVTVFSHLSPYARGIRDGLGQGEFANRMLLIMIPGLTFMCVGVALAGTLIAVDSPDSLHTARLVILPISGFLAFFGLGLAVWAFMPFPVPRWLRPKWLRDEDAGYQLQSFARGVRRAKRSQAANTRRGYVDLTPLMASGVAIALPEGWEIKRGKEVNTLANVTAAGTSATPAPAGRQKLTMSLVVGAVSSDTPATKLALRRSPQAADANESKRFMKALAGPKGWDIKDVAPVDVAGANALRVAMARGAAAQVRWVISHRGYCYVFSAEGESRVAHLQKLGESVLRTLVLPAP